MKWAKANVVTTLLNRTTVYNAETLLRLVSSHPRGTPLLTVSVSKHISTLDDPLMWGFKGFPTVDARLQRWVLAAEDIARGAGIYQQHSNEAFQILGQGEWLHSFPEGKVSQERAPIRKILEGGSFFNQMGSRRRHRDGYVAPFRRRSNVPWKD